MSNYYFIESQTIIYPVFNAFVSFLLNQKPHYIVKCLDSKERRKPFSFIQLQCNVQQSIHIGVESKSIKLLYKQFCVQEPQLLSWLFRVSDLYIKTIFECTIRFEFDVISIDKLKYHFGSYNRTTISHTKVWYHEMYEFWSIFQDDLTR